MFKATDPSSIVGFYAVAGIGIYLFWRFIVWIRESPTHPDPWEADVEQKLADPETPEICPHCSTPQPPTAWFCEHCGRAVGPYNNMMPYLHVFSEGEVLRNGTGGRLRKSWLIPVGYFLISINFMLAGFMVWAVSVFASLLMFAGWFFYWALIFKNLNRQEQFDNHP